MNTTREISAYVEAEEGGCTDIGTLLLNADWVLVKASDLRKLQEKADRPDKMAAYLISIAEPR